MTGKSQLYARMAYKREINSALSRLCVWYKLQGNPSWLYKQRSSSERFSLFWFLFFQNSCYRGCDIFYECLGVL